ncbi:hypothetical protein GWI33_005219 [Rhynchophorus ferrugineus]|uniref:Centrosome-associated protein 350 n=1 Tax=Rhynchophorus ferrugineus TaxID=354439 RepID=A0A834ING8_RHYFE|nr:hypothetical protein GWI33_005219 [Rhynchophorus ferrugineus]
MIFLDYHSDIMERKLDKDAVSKRILETSRETERLKEELQNLIAAGIQGNLNLSVPSVSKSQHNSSNKVQIIKSYDSKHSCHPVNVMSSENEVLSPKKDKHYDVQQSREYIKKQKEKRMAEIKSKKCETKIAMELKKEKLQELHQKANEIVKKNVEAKRQRSKSREPPIMRSRSVSREGKADLRSKPKIKDSQKDSKSKSQEPLVIRSRSANRDVKTIVKSTSSNVGVKKIDNVKNKNKESKISSSHLNSGIDSEIRALSRDSIIHGYNCAGRSKKYSSSTSSMDIKPITETNIPQTCERLLNGELITTKNTNLLYPPDFQVKPLQGPEISLETQKYNLYDKCKNQLYQDSLPSYEGDTDQPISQERSRRDIFLKDVYISKQITSRKGSSKESSSIHSETSMSIAAETGTDHEMKSIASKTHSMVNILSTQSDHKHTELSESINASVEPRKSISDSALTNMKQKLLMREKALAKRRKTVEELLQWHQKLLREERAIEDLESQVKNIFTNIPSEKEDEAAVNVSNASYREDKPPEMSKNIPQSTKDHAEDTRSSADKYNTEFEADDGSSISSISQLIEGFNKIEDNILNFSLTYPARNQFGEQIDEVLEYEKQESVKSTSSSTSIIDSNAESLKPAVEEQVGDKSLVADSKITTDKLPQRNVCVVQPGHQESSDRDINEIEDAPEKCAIERTVPLEIDDNISEKNSTDEVSEQSDVLSAVELEKEASIQSVISSESIVNTLQPENSIVQEISITKDGSVNLEELLTSVQQPVVEDTPTVDEISIREVGGDVTTTAESHDETHSLISQLNEDAAEQIVVHEETPSTSHQTIEQVTSEDIVQNDILEDTSNSLRQYSENKTDEEKVASLSTRTPSRDQSIVVTSNEENASLRSEEKISTEEDIVVAEPGPNQSSTSSIAATEETQEDVSVSLLESCVDDVELEESCQKSLVTLGKDKTSVDAQEMLEDVNSASKSNGSTEVQEARVMTYDLLSPSDAGFPLDEKKSFSLGNEAEELLRKQLAIEQEIKLLTEQQQKEQMSLVYMREIPNKPPPPYTPPSKTKTVKVATVIPSTKDEIQQITEYSAKIIHKAYVSNNLDNISISDKTLSLIAKNINKGCYKYVFNLCKDIAIDHYGQFLDETPGPSWMRPEERSFSFEQKPLDGNGLQQLMNKKLLELFGFQKQEVRRENAIMKWSRKKRDHVDEVLIREMQAEEKSWTNTEKDELLVKNRITNEIMDLLLRDTVQVLKKTISLKNENII